MNNVTIVGRLTKDPDMRYAKASNSPDGQMAIANFTVAIDRGKDKNGNDRGADYPRVTVFGKQAENCERFLAKGLRVAIQGHIQTGSYKDRDGRTVYTTDVIADRVEFIDFKGKDASRSTEEPTRGHDDAPEGFMKVDEDEVPF